MGKIKLTVYHDNRGWDVSGIVKQITWSGRKGSASRTIEAVLIDDPSRKQIGIKNVENGYTCIFSYNKNELFRGIIKRVRYGSDKTMTIKAYDICDYLANSKDSFCYENKTANEIVSDVLKRAGLTEGTIAGTGYRIPSLKKEKTSYYDIILEALSSTYKATKTRYDIRADQKKVDLYERKKNAVQWILETKSNITNYEYSDSIEKIKTRYRVYSKEGNLVKEYADSELEKKIGRYAMADKADDGSNEAQLDKLVRTMVQENGKPEKTISIEALGIPSVKTGVCIYLSIPERNLKRTYYVDSDTHVFSGEKHTMKLSLNIASDISSIE
ncbi:MAG: hypothetical protein ACI4D9_03940 [Lachnospiraceae bacterium]